MCACMHVVICCGKNSVYLGSISDWNVKVVHIIGQGSCHVIDGSLSKTVYFVNSQQLDTDRLQGLCHNCQNNCNYMQFHKFRLRPNQSTANVHDVSRLGREALSTVLSLLSAIDLTFVHDFWSSCLRLQGRNYKKILRLSYDVIITYDNRKSNLR